MDLSGFVAALRVGGAMIYPLLLLAVIAVVVILEKAFVFSTRTRLPAPVLEILETYAFAWEDLEQRVGQMDPRNYFRRFFRVILDQRARPTWWVESRAAEEATLIEQALGRWLWALETIVTAAPLLGLLGTITGMIRAFHLFGSEGLVDPRGVTGGVAEALIATAVGLFIALIALFAFNYFSNRQAQVMDEMEQLGTRVVDHLRLEARTARREVPPVAPASPGPDRDHPDDRRHVLPARHLHAGLSLAPEPALADRESPSRAGAPAAGHAIGHPDRDA